MTTVKDYPREALLRVATPLGLDLELAAAGGEIVASSFVRKRRTENAVPVVPRVLLEAKRQIDAYFACKLLRFDLPLRFEGTPFECDVWRQVAALAFGEFVSYADVARAAGRPLAHRGVARAMGNTPFALFVPAHRVVGADGRPRGLSPKGTRAWLIRFEREALRARTVDGGRSRRTSRY